MPDVYIDPSDLSPIQAQQVLDFLNRATSAQQLAVDIEFPGEPDIGVKLGQRLLDARAALGDSFTAIAQVRAVRLIGPERFTEICVAALGLQPGRWVELFYGASPMVAQSETGLEVTLDARPQPAWVGQSLALTVRVADRGGTPRAGVAVAVHTAVGRLVWMYGFQRLEGEAVTVLTGADGTAELELLREPSEPLSEVHRAALEHALAALDVNAGDPLKLEADFRALAATYLSERSYNLRRAIDLFVRDRREAMIASINPGTWRLIWPVESALVQADVLAPAGGGSAVARAVATVQWKNWVGAWLEFLGDVLRESAGLDARFGQAVARATDAEVLNDLLGDAQRFVANQAGRSALWLGQKAIDAAVSRVVSSDLEAVAPEARAAVLTQFEVAAREVSPTALGSYALVRSSRNDLVGRLDKIGALDLEQLQQAEVLRSVIDRQAAQVEGLAAQVAQVAQQNRQIGDRLGSFDADLARFRTELATFDATRATLTRRLDGLNTDLTRLQLNVERLQAPRATPAARKVARAAKSPASNEAVGSKRAIVSKKDVAAKKGVTAKAGVTAKTPAASKNVAAAKQAVPSRKSPVPAETPRSVKATASSTVGRPRAPRGKGSR